MLGTFASRELLPNSRRAVGDFFGGSLGTLEVGGHLGPEGTCRALLGTFAALSQGCPLPSEVTLGQKAKEPPLQVSRRGRSGPKGPFIENSRA